MKTKKSKLISYSLIGVCVLLLILLCVSVSLAYFGMNRKFQGSLNFSDGIVLDYKNASPTGEKSFSLLKLGNSRTIGSYNNSQDLTEFKESKADVSSDEVFYLANPYIMANTKSVACYVRMKVGLYTTFVDERELTDKEIKNVFGTLDPLSINLATDADFGFVKKGDYYYLSNAGTTSVSGYQDLYILNNNDNNKIYLFESDNEKSFDVEYFVLKLNEIVDEFLVDNFKIKIEIESIDGRAESKAVESNIWSLN